MGGNPHFRKGLILFVVLSGSFLKGSQLVLSVTVYCDHRVGLGCNDSSDLSLTQGNGVW